MRPPFNNISLQWLPHPPWFPPAREPPQTISTLKKTPSENLTSAITAVTLLKRVREVITFAYFLLKDILLALFLFVFRVWLHRSVPLTSACSTCQREKV